MDEASPLRLDFEAVAAIAAVAQPRRRRRRRGRARPAEAVASLAEYEPLQSAFAKVAAAAARPRDAGSGLSALAAAKDMDAQAFARALRATPGLKLDAEEVGALVALFDRGDGIVASSEFLSLFSRLGSACKAQRHAAAERASAAQRERWQQREDDAVARFSQHRVRVAGDWDEVDRDSALRKLEDAADKYDRDRGGKVQGFEARAVAPMHFRDQLKIQFGMQLSQWELGALLDAFRFEGPLLADASVDAHAFTAYFFRLVTARRTAAADARRTAARRRADDGAAAETAMRRRFGANKDVRIVLPQIAAADAPARGANAFEDALDALARAPTGCARAVEAHFSALDADAALAPEQFRAELRNAGAHLSSYRFGALARHFDAAGHGLISVGDFAAALSDRRCAVGRVEQQRQDTVGRLLEQFAPVAPVAYADDGSFDDRSAASARRAPRRKPLKRQPRLSTVVDDDGPLYTSRSTGAAPAKFVEPRKPPLGRNLSPRQQSPRHTSFKAPVG
ncbi:hypothetical protein M885DRAFT_584552 [Pelagophyceae sp. CCMP2097]|nr:hypothetical protein M885DRAFT_584552 [Pelagophyceae sp. CCMP2097]